MQSMSLYATAGRAASWTMTCVVSAEIFSARRRDLVEPFRAAGDELDPEEAQVPAVLSLCFVHHVGDEDDLDLLDVVAIEEQLDAAQQRLAPLDLDKRPARLGRLPRRGGGQKQHAEGGRHGQAPARV